MTMGYGVFQGRGNENILELIVVMDIHSMNILKAIELYISKRMSNIICEFKKAIKKPRGGIIYLLILWNSKLKCRELEKHIRDHIARVSNGARIYV